MALLSIVFGVIGYLLRLHEVATVFDPISGLAARGMPVSLALIGLSVFVIACLFVMSLAMRRARDVSFAEAFGKRPFGQAMLIFLGLAVTAFSALEFLAAQELEVLELIRIVTGLTAGFFGLFLMAVLAARGTAVIIPAVLPVFWLCLWLVLSHIDQASDPVLLGYAYQLFALALLLLSFYFIAGYAFGQARPGHLMFSTSSAIYFTIITLADNWNAPQQRVLFILTITALIYHLLLTTRLHSSDRAPKPARTHSRRDEWQDATYPEQDPEWDDGVWRPEGSTPDA